MNREKNVANALRLIRQRFNNLKCSSVYETAPVGFTGDLFYNLVAVFNTHLVPADVVDALKDIENQCGRDRKQQKFSNRSVDLDLLLYDNLILNEGKVNVPRDEILDYAFVLEPLAELAPELIHPQLGISYAQLWKEYDKDKTSQRRLAGMLEKLMDFPI